MKINEIELKYEPLKQPVSIKTSLDAFNFLIANWDLDAINIYEEFKIILLDRANTVLGIRTISKGGTTATVVDPKILFSIGLKALANGIILAHNHPSGNIRPSEVDNGLTKKLIEGGKLLDLVVLDHLIVTNTKYFSYADEGRI